MSNFLEDFEGNGGKKGFGFKTLIVFVLIFVISAGACVALTMGAGADLLEDEASLGSDNSQIEVSSDVEETEDVVTTASALDSKYGIGITVTVGEVVSPSVVFISNIQNMSYGYFASTDEEIVASTGSGVIYGTDGYIITNYHVVEGASKISVTLYDGTSLLADVVATDSQTDLAVIKIDTDIQLQSATFGDSDEVRMGELAVAIGNPAGEAFANSMTSGIISGLNRTIETSQGIMLELIQTDAAINPGNSGGALANGRGEVIGINTVKISMDGYEGMGFAIPSNNVIEICDQLIEYGKVIRPALGVQIIAEITPQLAYYNNLTVEEGIIVYPIEDSAAEVAGIEGHDIITHVDGVAVSTTTEIQTEVFSHNIGDEVTVTVVRGDETLEIPVVLGEY